MALGGFCAYLSIFAPGMLLFTLVTPSYAKIREHKAAGWIFAGANAAATGLMWQAAYIISVKSIGGRDNGTSILGYPVFIGLAVCTFVLCCDFAGDGSGGINPVWMIVCGALVGVIDWAIVVR
jgi:chromate transport protein ChrA